MGVIFCLLSLPESRRELLPPSASRDILPAALPGRRAVILPPLPPRFSTKFIRQIIIKENTLYEKAVEAID